MTTPTQPPNLQDDRWGGYVPWFLRHPDLAILGQFDLFFDRAAPRLEQFFLYGEGGDLNVGHMGALIASESHQCFRFDNGKALAGQIRSYFSSALINLESEVRTTNDRKVDQKERTIQDFRRELVKKVGIAADLTLERHPTYVKASKELHALRLTRREYHRGTLVRERITVLESVLRLVQTTPNFPKLRADLRRYLAEAQLMLDIKEKPAKIVPMEEALLQKEVIDHLLPRLAARFPQQEKDLVKAYHDFVQGVDANTIFGNAFKALEELTRQMTGDQALLLNKAKDLQKHFPLLHPTIHATIKRLADHRGDKAGHGRQGPPPQEMRYLLFSICNVALLFLDYPSPTKPASAS